MWKGRVLMGARRAGEALERRAILVRKDMIDYDGDTMILAVEFRNGKR